MSAGPAATVRALLKQAESRLGDRGEAEVLLLHALGPGGNRDRSWLFAWPEFEPDQVVLGHFEELLARRLAGEPVAYITGRREFWSLPLAVDPSVLIPRPDTEVLVEWALALMSAEHGHVLDLGTGSGAIALALASERTGWQVYATDQSAEALACAAANAKNLGLGIELLRGDWFAALPTDPDRFDLIVSNPPYVAVEDPHLRQGDLPREPQTALISGIEGLDDIRRIVGEAPHHLRPGGWLLLEHGFGQGAAVRRLLGESGFDSVNTRTDLAGLERVSGGRRSSLDT